MRMTFNILCRRCQKFLRPSSLVNYQQSATAIFYQKNRRGTDEDPETIPLGTAVKRAAREFRPEFKLWCEEVKEKWTTNPRLAVDHGEYEVMYKFDTPESVSKWMVSTDQDNHIGKSTANFTFTKNRTGLFHGNLSQEVVKDGVTKYSGFANITSPRPMKSFYRESSMDWSLFNSLVLRVRGDGRPYMIVIGCDYYFDVNWLNRFNYPLFTRGGPYWQLVKIPFTKFFVSYQGRIQDHQEQVPLNMVNSVGFTLGDGAEGPFCLEIDSIAVMYDVNISKASAYEMYRTNWWEVQT